MHYPAVVSELGCDSNLNEPRNWVAASKLLDLDLDLMVWGFNFWKIQDCWKYWNAQSHQFLLVKWSFWRLDKKNPLFKNCSTAPVSHFSPFEHPWVGLFVVQKLQIAGLFFSVPCSATGRDMCFFPFLQHVDPPSPVPNLNKIFTKKKVESTHAKKNIYTYIIIYIIHI